MNLTTQKEYHYMDSAVFQTLWTNSEQSCILIWLRVKALYYLEQILCEPGPELPNSQAQ